MLPETNGLGPLEEVVRGGYCVGCGACAAAEPELIEMVRTSDGTMKPWRVEKTASRGLPKSIGQACPFSRDSISEDELSREFLPGLAYVHGETGRFLSAGVCHVEDERVRARSSSGGFGRWLLYRLLKEGVVSHVVDVVPNVPSETNAPLFQYRITDNTDQVLAGATSAYYPVHLAIIVDEIKSASGPVAITAIPCFAKAIRQLSRKDVRLREQIAFVVGIICGHMKSAAFAELLGWQVGVKPENLSGVDFRRKLPGLPANHKGFTALDNATGRWSEPVDTKELLGGNWGHGLMKNSACDYCDDVVAETADVAVGDAWLPQYTEDTRGHSIVIIRNPTIQQFVHQAIERKELRFHEVSADTVAQSQAGGLRHRREGLRYRLWLKQHANQWHPPKRVSASRNHIRRSRQKMYETRMTLAQESLEFFEEARAKGDFNQFRSRMMRRIREHHHLQNDFLARLRRKASSSWVRVMVRRVIGKNRESR